MNTPLKTKLIKSILFAGLAVLMQNTLAETLNDDLFTEDARGWARQTEVTEFTTTTDSKVGECSLSAVLPGQGFIRFPKDCNAGWDLSRYDRLVFWAKADCYADFLLILAKDENNRTDADIRFTPEWQEFEIPLNKDGFRGRVAKNAGCLNVFSFKEVNWLSFYNNGGPTKIKIWIDGLECVKDAPTEKATKPKIIP